MWEAKKIHTRDSINDVWTISDNFKVFDLTFLLTIKSDCELFFTNNISLKFKYSEFRVILYVFGLFQAIDNVFVIFCVHSFLWIYSCKNIPGQPEIWNKAKELIDARAAYSIAAKAPSGTSESALEGPDSRPGFIPDSRFLLTFTLGESRWLGSCHSQGRCRLTALAWPNTGCCTRLGSESMD